MKKTAAEPYRDIDFTNAKRGPVVPSEPGKTKISIRLDNRVLEYFRSIVETAGGGNYQTLINDALMAYIQQQSMLEAVRQAVREELQPVVEQAGLTRHCRDERNSSLLGFEVGNLDAIGWCSPGGASPPQGNGEPPAR